MASEASENPVKPYTEADFIGPEDRPKAPWELPMYRWRVLVNSTVMNYLQEMDGTAIQAVQCAAKADQGRIYVRACSPGAPKAHMVSLNPTHRLSSFSLYTPLLPFHFPRVGKRYKAIFSCWADQFGDEKVLVIQVKGYRIERVDPETRRDTETSEEQTTGGNPENVGA